LLANNVKRRQIKLDQKELEKDVKQNPESIISRQSKKKLELILQLYFIL